MLPDALYSYFFYIFSEQIYGLVPASKFTGNKSAQLFIEYLKDESFPDIGRFKEIPQLCLPAVLRLNPFKLVSKISSLLTKEGIIASSNCTANTTNTTALRSGTEEFEKLLLREIINLDLYSDDSQTIVGAPTTMNSPPVVLSAPVSSFTLSSVPQTSFAQSTSEISPYVASFVPDTVPLSQFPASVVPYPHSAAPPEVRYGPLSYSQPIQVPMSNTLNNFPQRYMQSGSVGNQIYNKFFVK